MLEQLFKGLFDTELTAVISVADFLLCLGFSLLLGLLLALAYMYRTRYTKSFVVTLALLPAVVCVVIMMVNGNVGAGVAVAGAFSLVRFRSVPARPERSARCSLRWRGPDRGDGLSRLRGAVYRRDVRRVSAVQPAGLRGEEKRIFV